MRSKEDERGYCCRRAAPTAQRDRLAIFDTMIGVDDKTEEVSMH